MALAQEDIELIRTHLGDWLAEYSLGKPPVVYEIEQVDRRLDEMLKRHDHQFLWLIGFIASGFGLLLAAIRYL